MRAAAAAFIAFFLVAGDAAAAPARAKPVPLADVYFLTAKHRKKPLVCTKKGAKPVLGFLGSVSDSIVEVAPLPSGKVPKKTVRAAKQECSVKLSAPQCHNGRDDDADGARDFPADSNCVDINDTSEEPEAPSDSPYQVMFRPFAGQFFISNFFDHEYPRQYFDDNGFQRTCDGETTSIGIDGHQGIDYRLPEGTEILAAYDGTVAYAGPQTTFYCPILGANVSGLEVGLSHSINGKAYLSSYHHLSRIDVASGATVVKGQVIGLSGNTGCSTGAHLHFEVSDISGSLAVPVDPYGWNGAGSDPWASDPAGAVSELLWMPGEAPPLFQVSTLDPNPNQGDNAAVAITAVRWMGRKDDANPNNEYVELVLDPRHYASDAFFLSGYRIVNNAGEAYVFPSGAAVREGKSIKLWSGSGTNDAENFYWNRSSGAWNNDGDCAQLFRPNNGNRMYSLRYGDACVAPTAISSAAARTGVEAYDPPVRDFSPPRSVSAAGTVR